MTEYTIRELTAADVPALKSLWSRVFEDSAEYIEAFFALLPGLGVGIVAEAESRVLGSAYLLLPGKISPGGEKCGLIYAVAVDKAQRKAGIGGELVRSLTERARAMGCGHITVLPAELSLYRWYEKAAGFRCCLYRQILSFTAKPLLPVESIGFEEYSRRRERLLSGTVHLEFTSAALRLEEQLCKAYGGGFYAFPGGIAAAYAENEKARLAELLCEGEQAEAAAASVAAFMGKEQAECLLETDSDRGLPYIAALEKGLPEGFYWGPAFD